MSTITQIQCDIDTCTDNAAFTGVQTTVKSASGQLEIQKLDLCAKHKQELVNLTPIVSSGNKTFSFTNATR